MTNKSNFLKKLLTTASVLVVATAATNALGDARTVVGNNQLDKDNSNKDVALKAASTLLFNGAFSFDHNVALSIAGIDVKANKATLNAKAGKSFTLGPVIRTGGNTNSLTLNLDGGTHITLNGTAIPALQKINNHGANSQAPITPGSANDYTALGDVNFSNVNDKITFDSAAAALKGDFVAASNGVGNLVFKQNNTLEGAVGSKDKFLNNIEVKNAAAKTLTLKKDSGGLYAQTVTSPDQNRHSLSIQGKDYEIHADIGTKGREFVEVNFDGDVAGTTAATIKLMPGKTVHATNFDIAKTNALNNSLELHEGSTIVGDVISTQANNGSIFVKGDAEIDGNVGTTLIKQIVFDTEGKTLTITKATVAVNDNIDFQKDATLNLTSTDDVTLAKKIMIAKDNEGTVKYDAAGYNKKLTFAGEVGDLANDKSSKMISVTGGADVILNEKSSVAKIDFGSNVSTLTLGKATDYLIKDLVGATNTTVKIGANLTLKKGTDLGSATDRIKALDLGNNTLILEDNVNIVTGASGITNAAPNNGTLTFKGTSIVDAIAGQNNTLSTINVEGADSVVTFKQKVNLAGNIVIHDKATIVLEGAVKANEIKGDAAEHGTVKFANKMILKDSTQIAAQIGSTKLDTVELAGQDITFSHATFATDNLKFSSDSNLTATFTDATHDLFTNMKLTTTSKARQHNIKLAKRDYQFDTQVGTEENAFGDFTLTDDNVITLKNKFYGSVKTTTSGEGTVTFSTNNSLVLNIGSADKEFKTVTFASNGDVLEDIWAKNIVVNQGQTAKFGGIVSGSDKLTLDTNSIVNASNAKINIAVTTTKDQGTINFDGNSEINKIIGASDAKFLKIAFNGDDAAKNTTKVTQNFYANDISVDKHNLIISNAVITSYGDISFNDGSKISLGTNELHLADGKDSKISGTSTISVTLDKDLAIGTLTADDDAALDASNANITFVVTDNAGMNEKDQSYTIMKGAITDLGTSEVKLTSKGNRFVKWSADGYTINRTNIAGEVLTSVLGAEVGSIYGNKKNSGDALNFVSDLAQFSDDAKIKEAYNRLSENTVTAASEVITDISDSTDTNIHNRVGSLSSHPKSGRQLANARIVSGVAAGDSNDDSMYGVWLTPFYNSTTHDKSSDSSGFDVTTGGVTVGADLKANADLSVGVAVSYANSNVKHKNVKSGDKTESDTFAFSLYSVQQLTDNWFMQGQISVANTDVKSKEKRLTSTGSETAKGKFDTTSFASEVLTGYSVNMDSASITPLVGLGFSRVGDSSYTETGTTHQNKKVHKNGKSKLDVVLGFSAQMATEMSGLSINPEIHGFVRHDLLKHNHKVKSTHAGLVNQLQSKSTKANRTTFNGGLSVNVISGMYEYGAGYDFYNSKKALGHQGTLKVRVNF